MAPLPLINLGILLLKQLSKPVANALKRRAKTKPFFRNKICIPAAQALHYYETRIKMKLMGLNPSAIKPLNEEMAIETGAEIIGEIFIFAFGSSFILVPWILTSYYEVFGKSTKTKENELQKELASLRLQVDHVAYEMKQQNNDLKDIINQLNSSPFKNIKEKLLPKGASKESDQGSTGTNTSRIVVPTPLADQNQPQGNGQVVWIADETANFLLRNFRIVNGQER